MDSGSRWKPRPAPFVQPPCQVCPPPLTRPARPVRVPWALRGTARRPQAWWLDVQHSGRAGRPSLPHEAVISRGWPPGETPRSAGQGTQCPGPGGFPISLRPHAHSCKKGDDDAGQAATGEEGGEGARWLPGRWGGSAPVSAGRPRALVPMLTPSSPAFPTPAAVSPCDRKAGDCLPTLQGSGNRWAITGPSVSRPCQRQGPL